MTRDGHSGGPTRPDFFHPDSGWARSAPARPVCKNPARPDPDRDRAIPIQPEILSYDSELEFITEKIEINLPCDDHHYKFSKVLIRVKLSTNLTPNLSLHYHL